MHAHVWDRFCSLVRGRRIAVLGLGLQGGALRTIHTLVRAGAHVRVSDQKTAQQLRLSVEQLPPEVPFTAGGHPTADTDWADIVLKNPGMLWTHPEIQRAQAAGKLVTTETALTLSLIADRSVGVTGTRGKTTTTTLIHHIVTAAHRPALLGGNIPQQPTMALLEDADDRCMFVLEIPSYHLEALAYLRVSPHIGVFTSFSPDHLDRYGSEESYLESKSAIARFQHRSDALVCLEGEPWSTRVKSWLQPGAQWLGVGEEALAFVRKSGWSLTGDHNLRNAALAVVVARHLHIDDTIIRSALASFTGVPFRQQVVGEVHGIRFINDTTATTPVALTAALRAMTEPFVLIAGGTTKKLPFPPDLLDLMHSKPRATVFLRGSGTAELQQALHSSAPVHDTLESAFQASLTAARETGASTVLFSPGFSSFELFQNEFDRGEQFNALVRRLATML